MKNYICILLLSMSLISCSAKTYCYKIRIKNVASNNIYNTLAQSKKGFDFDFGFIGPDTWTTHAGPKNSTASDEFTILWIDDSGENHSKSFDLKTKINKSFNDTLVFNINENNDVSFETCVKLCKYDYHLKYKNTGSKPIYELNIRKEIGSSHLNIKDIVELKPKKSAISWGPMNFPPNDVFEVSWKSSDNKIHTKKIDLRKQTNEQYKGTIIISIDKDNDLTCRASSNLNNKFIRLFDACNPLNVFNVFK